MPSLRVHVARTFRERLVGWAGRRAIAADEVLLFPRCRSVHTFGMRVPIDIIMIDAEQRVIAVHTQVRPFRIVRGSSRVDVCLELCAGGVAARGIEVGDILNTQEIVPVDNLRNET